MMDYNIKDKICLVTGGSRGLGKVIVESFLKQGATVILIARNATAEKFEGNYYSYDYDLLDKASVEKSCDTILKEVGLPDIVIHNLGGSCQVTADFCSSEEWEKVWRFNLGISIDLNNRLLPLLINNKQGAKIIHITSSSTKALTGYTPYISAKGALNSYIKSMALKYSMHNILINGVSPGAINLPGRYFSELQKSNPAELKAFLERHVAIRRLAEPEEIAAVVLFLASRFASYITGTIIEVDGGMI